MNFCCPKCDYVFSGDGIKMDPQPGMTGPLDTKVCEDCKRYPIQKVKRAVVEIWKLNKRHSSVAGRMPYKD